MNVISLQHTCVQNQQTSSWKDETLVLKGGFKGVININHKRNISEFAEELAYQFGAYDGNQYSLKLSDLSEYDQNELARLYIELTGRELTECVNGTDFSVDNEYTCALLAMLKNDCKESRDSFIDVILKNIISYYNKPLQNILDEACHDLLCNLKNESGYTSSQDRETGEIYWSKS